MGRIRIDLNNRNFQEQWFALESNEVLAVVGAMRKIARVTWDDLYRDRGLRWEAINNKSGPEGQKVYSLRITQRARAVAYRDGDILRLVSLHPDHDSAYR